MQNAAHHIHFIGVSGSGMIGLARWCLLNGHSVSGSDLKVTAEVQDLCRRGLILFQTHAPENLASAKTVVYSSAVAPDNPELIAAHASGCRVVRRGEFLAELASGMRTIAICGSHGKSTTTALLGHTLHRLAQANCYVGASFADSGASFLHGMSQTLVAEVDESDGSFLSLEANQIVLTGISDDHASAFGGVEALHRAFVKFLRCQEGSSPLLICGDCPESVRAARASGREFIRYGLSSDCDFVATIKSRYESSTQVQVDSGGRSLGTIRLPLIGDHNVSNLLPTIILALQMGFDFPSVQRCAESFPGIAKRMQLIHHTENLKCYIDYAHNPEKIRAAIRAVRLHNPQENIICFFEPHRYSRLAGSWSGFLDAFDSANIVIVLPIFSAGETPHDQVDISAFANALAARWPELRVCQWNQHTGTSPMSDKLYLDAPSGIFLFLGAGRISEYMSRALESLGKVQGWHSGKENQDLEGN